MTGSVAVSKDGLQYRFVIPGTRNAAGSSANCRALPSREILPQRGPDLLQRPVDLVARDHKWRGDADRVSMGVLGKDASALQCLTVATCIACFRVKLDRQHEPASAHVTSRVAPDAPQAIETYRAFPPRLLSHPPLSTHPPP